MTSLLLRSTFRLCPVKPLFYDVGKWCRAVGLSTLTALISACASIGPSTKLAAPAPVFAPLAFFTGHTVGEGILRVTLSHARRVHVVSDGRVEPDGTLVLIQRVEEGSKPPRERTWHMRDLGGGLFAVSLSDAIGPVEADVAGNRLHLRFRAKGGLGIEQWIYRQPGGDTALNRMVVRKFGLPVASLHETIRQVR
ncbi:DUF3833 family protein [Sphingomonas sp. TX0543]|uniref:DUF3833 family protein n=1 Tax=unclassified Sphingomonas TaxID=196159 RepID=UPI0020164FE2|nr:DUF3833 family protein [Sphingomonas sp. 3P27F8]